MSVSTDLNRHLRADPEGPLRCTHRGIALPMAESLGACDARNRGEMKRLRGATATDPDEGYVCEWDGNSFEWQGFTLATNDDRYVNTSGDAMTGALEVGNDVDGRHVRLAASSGAGLAVVDFHSGDANPSVRQARISATSDVAATDTGTLNIQAGITVFNESGADADVRMEGDTVTDLFFLDASDDMIYNERLSVPDSGFFVYDNADATKRAQFQLSGITTATDRTYTLPNTNGTLALQSQAESLTIASGAITVSGPWIGLVVLDTEGGGPTDDLDTINGGTVGQLISINSAIDTRDPTIKDGTGNLRLAGDFTLTGNNDSILLRYGNPGPVWREAGRSDNA